MSLLSNTSLSRPLKNNFFSGNNQSQQESIIKLRNSLNQIRSPPSKEEVSLINDFCSLISRDNARIQPLSYNSTCNQYFRTNDKKSRDTIVIVASSNNLRICVDVLNRVELFCTSLGLYGYWDGPLANAIQSTESCHVHCLCIGHPPFRIVRPIPRAQPILIEYE